MTAVLLNKAVDIIGQSIKNYGPQVELFWGFDDENSALNQIISTN
jgi:hypothetical protein